MSDLEKKQAVEVDLEDVSSSYTSPVPEKNKFGYFTAKGEYKIKRKLLSRHVQLIAIGGAIGTSIFVTIGGGLVKAGPLGLLLAFVFWAGIIIMLTTAVGEMVSYLPVPSPFITMAGRVVDEAMEFSAGWNFYLMESLYIPFEITAVNSMIHYWRDDYSPAITLCVQIVLYTSINIFAVKIFGEVEFWLSLGKLMLIIGLLFFTLISMCGANPQGDAFGFRNWHNPGGPINEFYSTGATGRFQGIVSGLISAAFVIAGVEYMSMTASECINPRKVMPIAYKSVLYRLITFCVGSALCVGILVNSQDPDFITLNAGGSNAAASPYVIAMKNLGIKVLPDLINVVIITSAFSAGNSYVFCSSRVLYGLAKRGFAPKIFSYCNKQGVPIFCILVSIVFSLLSLLQLGSQSATVLGYIVSICTGSQVLNYAYMAVSYIGFYRACKAQNIDRGSFSYKSWFQPYSVYIALFFLVLMVCILGYENFLPGMWSTSSFIFNYIMVFVNMALFIFWKLWKKTRFVNAAEADLTSGLDEVEEHEYEYYSKLNLEGGDKLTFWSRLQHWFL